MRRILSHELQMRVGPRLDAKTRKTLKSVGMQGSPKSEVTKSSSPKLKAGAQIMREWNGVTHKVEVAESGFIWQGQHYRSLSAIAEAITGAHWSGPRFFGLNSRGAANA